MNGIVLNVKDDPGWITIPVIDFTPESILNAVAGYLKTKQHYLKMIRPELVAILGNAPEKTLTNHGLVRVSGLGSEDMPIIFEIRKTKIISQAVSKVAKKSTLEKRTLSVLPAYNKTQNKKR
jgi:hypothetical protein